jgi:hypothetical protein
MKFFSCGRSLRIDENAVVGWHRQQFRAHCHSYVEASFAIFRISTGVVEPETAAITNSSS